MDFFFNDSQKNKDFEEQGYCKLHIGIDVVEAINQIYHVCYQKQFKEFYGNHRHETSDFNHMINDMLSEVITSRLEEMGILFQPVFASFAIKPKKYQTEFNLHQDWSVVDESSHNSAQIWIPTIDSDASNGGLFVMDRSHLFFNNHRSGSYPITEIKRTGLLKYLTAQIALKKGEALMFKHSLFHGSVANRSEVERVAVIFCVIGKNSKNIYYHKKDTNISGIVDIDPDFYLSHMCEIEMGKLPEGYHVINEKRYQHSPISRKQLVIKYFQHLF